MIIDVTGIELTPGNYGSDCLGNGNNEGVECCCDEGDYFLCCFSGEFSVICASCQDLECPRKSK